MQKENRKYYEAYEDRYKTAHEKGVSWEQMKNTPIVMDIINRYHLHPEPLRTSGPGVPSAFGL